MKIKESQEGYTLIVVGTFLFVFVLGAVALTSFVTNNIRAVNKLNEHREAGYLAQAGIEKAVWCLNHSIDVDCGGAAGLNYVGETNTPLGDGVFSTLVYDDGNDKIVHATGTLANGAERAIKVTIQQVNNTTDVSFFFGAQIGDGGLVMGNNSVIVGSGGTVGNVHSNGNIICGSNGAISGTAIVSNSGNRIQGCDIGYDGNGLIVNNLADAWAHNIQNTRVAHDGNIPTGGQSQSSSYGLGSMGGQLNNNVTLPAPTTFPVTGQMVTDWEAEALVGGTIVGDYITSDGETLGPKKIEGDLEIGENNSFVITGTLWIEGNLTFGNNSVITLDTGYGANSGVIVVDNALDLSGSGFVTFGNSVSIDGSGDPDSYVLLLSTNTSNQAIDVGNTATNAIYVTPNGFVKAGNNADLKAVVAYGLDVGNNMTLTYESGLASSNFASGPGGSWQIKRETWQILK